MGGIEPQHGIVPYRASEVTGGLFAPRRPPLPSRPRRAAAAFPESPPAARAPGARHATAPRGYGAAAPAAGIAGRRIDLFV